MADKPDVSLDEDDLRLDEEAQSRQSGEESALESTAEYDAWSDESAPVEDEAPDADAAIDDDYIYRSEFDPVPDQVRAEQERLAAERAARREAREAALAPTVEPAAAFTAVQSVGTVGQPTAPQAQPVVVFRRTTDKFFGALGLFLLRLVLAAILGIRGINGLLSPQLAATPWEGNLLPQPQLIGLALSAAGVGIAILLVFGMLTRLAGFGLATIAVSTLVFVKWGDFSPFLPGELGFVGELEVLLAASGLLLLFVGSGGWSVDYGFRRRRSLEASTRKGA